MGFIPLAELEQEQGQSEEQALGRTEPTGFTPLERERTWSEAAKDTTVQLAEGVNTILGAIPNLVAPESKAAGFFRDNADHWRDKQSEPLKEKIVRADESITAAGEDGVISQVTEAASQYFSDPALAARFVTTNLPSMIPGVGVAKVSQAAALARGASVARAAQVATTAAGATNAVLNAGGARGEAFEDIKRTLQQQGYSAQQAEELALKDSRVVAAVGGLTGFISGKTGLEGSIVGKAGAGGAVRAGARALAAELAGEQMEEVTPKLTTNLQAARYDGRSVGKDVGRTIVETAIGSGPGAVVAGGTTGLNLIRNGAGDQSEEAAQAPVKPQAKAVEAATDAVAPSQEMASTAKATPAIEVRLAELELLGQSRPLSDLEVAEAQDLVQQLNDADPVDSQGGFTPLAESQGAQEATPAPVAQSAAVADEATQQNEATQSSQAPSEARTGFVPLGSSIEAGTEQVADGGVSARLESVPSTLSLQNRDRSRAASVAQMADIARNPDYMRLATSRTPEAGAPMVFAVGDDLLKVPSGSAGNTDVAVMSDGQRVPFRYAVVDAGAVEPSHFVDGRSNPAFAANVNGTLKALNNGRAAGLRASYEEGTAEQYRAELVADAKAHGVPVEAIQRTQNPILVRVYSQNSNTPDMAAKSQGQGLGMSPAELAVQDAMLIDSGALAVLQPGDLSSAGNRDFARAFTGRLQQAGQDVAGMMTAEGTLSPAGRQRMQAALMQAAYGDSDLVGELFDSLDTDIKSIGEALKAVAGEWANLRDSARLGQINPAVDITDNLVQAVNLVRRARRDRTSLHDLTRQPDLMTGQTPDPITVGALRMFYSGSYMVRALGRDAMIAMLRDYARAAMATAAGADMFGEQVSAGQILSGFETQGDPNAQDPAQDGGRAPVGSQTPVGRPDEARQPTQRPSGDEGGARAIESGRRSATDTGQPNVDTGRASAAVEPEAKEALAPEPAPTKKPAPRTADRDYWAYAKEQGHVPKDVPIGSELHTRLKAEFEALKTGKARLKAITGKKLDGEWAAFSKASGALGVPRADMPQIKAAHRGALTQFLAARGATHQADADLDAASLRPTQAEFSTAKVKKAQDYEGGERSILISADSYVLDGHHQWLASLAQGLPIRAIRFDAPMAELLPLAREFPSADVAPGATTTPEAAAVEAQTAVDLNALRSEALPMARTGAFAKQGLTFEDRGGKSAIMFKGQEIATLDGARSRQNIVKAIRAAMAEAQVLTQPTEADVLAQQDLAAQAGQRDAREQAKREIEAGAGQFELDREEGRQDTTGDIFAQQDTEGQPGQPKKPVSVIDDAGEKIGGARKDRWKERGLNTADLDEMTEAEGAELATKANVWKPDYAAIAEMAEPVTASMVKVVYDSLAAKPKDNTPQGRRDYVKAMQTVRKVYGSVRSIEEAKSAYVKLREELGVQQNAGMRVLEKDSPAAIARRVLFSVYKGRSDPFVFGFNELQRAKKLAQDGFPGQTEPWRTRLSVSRMDGGRGTTLRGIELYMAESAELGTPMTEQQVRDGFYRVVDKKNKTLAIAATTQDAEAAAKTIYERDFKGGKDSKPEPERPHLDSMTREGLPARIERDVTSQDFIDAFGFRGVEFGNWSAQDERQRIINMAYDGLMDLAEIIGVPPKAMSLNGTLGMAFGARGTGRALAHYEPGKLVINMTKIRGGGSLAHEWAHGLDHYFGELNRQDAYQTKARGASGWMDEEQYKGIPRKRTEKVDGQWRTVEQTRLESLRPEVASAFDDVMETLFQRKVDKAEMLREHELGIEKAQAMAAKEENTELRAVYQRRASELSKVLDDIRKDPDDALYSGRGRTEYATEAQKLSGKSAKGYWLRPTEMFARAFESFVFDRLTAMGARSDYLVHGVEADRFAGGGYKGNPYPAGVERARVNAAFQKLVDTIESRETDDGKVILLSRIDGPVGGGTLGALDAIAKTDDLFSLPKSDADTIEQITADNDPEIKVRKTSLPGNETMYTLTMADGTRAILNVRKSGPNSVYGANISSDTTEWISGRPGENPEDVPDDTEDVWVDVSSLKPGQNGARVYNIAANFAHNTGRIFIGDPAGLSDAAMRRRAENMLSSALKFGTTKHLAPHPRQTDGATGIGVPALKWIYGDDIGNIERLIAVNVKALDSAYPESTQITYDPGTGHFGINSGDGRAEGLTASGLRGIVSREIADDRRAGGSRSAFSGAGWRTLARGAVFRALLRGRRAGGDGAGRPGAGEGILDQLVRQRAQLASPTKDERVFYSRNLNGEAGDLPGRISFKALEALAERIKAGAPNMPAVNVLADPSAAPPKLREYIIRQDAWYDVEGAMHDGELYLFASGLSDAARAEHVLIEHEAAHYGLRAVLGGSLKSAMRLVYLQNASVRKAAAELQKRGKLSDIVATEEVIVDIPSAELARLKGWRKVVEKARDWLAEHGYTALAERIGAWLDGTLTQQQRADLFVAELVRAARDHVKGKIPARAAAVSGTRLSGTLAEDIAKQEAWLQREAKARGFKDIEDLLERDYPAFEKLSDLWRKKYPADALLSRRQDQTEDEAFRKWFGDSKVVDEDGRPKVVYHGTKRDFSTFKSGKEVGVSVGTDASAELGIFFSNDLEYVEGLLDAPGGSSGFAEGANVMPVYSALRNPKIERMQKIQDIEDEWSAERARRYRKHLESQGHDGIIFQGVNSHEYVAFRPEQIKSAVGNRGTFDPAEQDVRLSRNNSNGQSGSAGGQVLPGAWNLAKAKVLEMTSPAAIDRLLYEFQDKLIDLRRLREHIKALGGTITDLNDAYLGEELYHKRLAKRSADFLDKELKPLLGDMRSRAVKLPELEQYLHARHAPEANRQLAQRNPNRTLLDSYRADTAKAVRDLETQLQRAKTQGTATTVIEDALVLARDEAAMWRGAQAFTGTEQERLALSGMSDVDAKAFMDSLTPRKRQHMEELATLVDKIQARSLDELEGYGLMDRATLNAWRSTYKFYVPLHRDEAKPDSDRHPIGQGFSVKGSGTKSRVGSNEKVTNILAHIAMQREAALTRGEKNNVVKKLYLLAAQNPDDEFWRLDAPPKVKTVDPRNGTVRTTIDPTYKHRPNVLMVRIAGRDKAIVFNEHNPSAVRLAESMKNLDIGDLHVVLGLVSKGTRWFASVNTQYNPIFGLVNFARDVQAGLLNLSTTPLAGNQKDVAKHVLTAMRAIYRQRRGKASRNSQWTALWDEFETVGATTGYRDLFADAEDRAKSLLDDIQALDRGQISKAAHAVVDWLSDYNEVMENAVRLSAYKVATDQGMSKEQAASLAKNLTVNFNRKGRQTRELGALYAFFNAALQGTARMAETLKGPIGKRIMFGGVALGMLNTLMGMAMMGEGDDDEPDNWDKIPEFIKERSVIIPLGREDYLTIPMPLGFHVFPNIGRLAVEFAFGEDHKSTGRRLGEMLSVLVDAFNPLGGAQNLGQMVSPTVIDPVVALMQNRDWTGRPIYRQDFSDLDPTPGHTRTKDSASSVSRGLAEAINTITGGSEYRPGAWSPTPDQIDYVFGQLTGGLGRELIKVNQTVTSAVTGDELPPYKVPLVGRLYGNTRGTAGQSERYYENLRTVNEVENELKGRQRKEDGAEGFEQREPLTGVIALGNQVERRIRELRAERRAVAEEKADGYQAEVRNFDWQIALAMTEFNNEVARVRRGAAK